MIPRRPVRRPSGRSPIPRSLIPRSLIRSFVSRSFISGLPIPRPLDPVRTIKAKLGVLVAASSCATALALRKALDAGIPARYALPVAVLAALLVTQVLARGMTSPLREMTAAARAMAAGHYDRRVRATSRDEVGELARAFNQMAGDLAETDRQRREFVANVSHELRTPISALHALLENLADGVTPARPETLATALDQTERLGRLISQLLDLSRVDGGGARLEVSEFRVEPFLTEVVAQAEAAYPDVRFTLDCAPGLTVVADRDRLHQIMANLVENAAVHGPPDGTVTVTTRAAARGGLRVEVTDDGPGIPPAERARVFERFSRGRSAGADGSAAADRSADDGGTGLGLAIARWAVDLHGGRIQVVDTDRGCRLRVVLPARPPQTAPRT
jgi:signal transduction histidine kinase